MTSINVDKEELAFVDIDRRHSWIFVSTSFNFASFSPFSRTCSPLSMDDFCPNVIYPNSRTEVYGNTPPKEKAWTVKGGRPINVPNRDIRFPLIWEVDYHPLTQGNNTSWVIIMDTSKEARRQRSLFQSELTTPLGPDQFMPHFGKRFLCF